MHIIIGILTAIAGLIWAIVALRNSGFDIRGLNPFHWFRRTQWKKNYDVKPLYKLKDPIDVAAVLIVATAKCEGEISKEQKLAINNIFTNEFHLNDNEAADLFVACTHLLKDEVYLSDNLNKLFQHTKTNFSQQQIESLLSLMNKIAQLEGPINIEQTKLIQATKNIFR